MGPKRVVYELPKRIRRLGEPLGQTRTGEDHRRAKLKPRKPLVAAELASVCEGAEHPAEAVEAGAVVPAFN
jgi:hypothetical protein